MTTTTKKPCEEIKNLPWRADGAGVADRQGNAIALVANDDDHEANKAFIVRCVNSHEQLLAALKAALADLEGIMPEFEPSGERMHPGWLTIAEARAAIDAA